MGEKLIRPAQIEGAALDGVIVEPDEVLRPGYTGQPFGPPEHVKATVGCDARDGLVEHTRSQSGDLFIQQVSRPGGREAAIVMGEPDERTGLELMDGTVGGCMRPGSVAQRPDGLGHAAGSRRELVAGVA